MSFIAAIVSGAEAAEAKIAALPTKYRSRLVDSLKRQWLRVQAYVVKEKLSGDPLKRRTGVLASSINVGGPQSATEFVEQGNSFIARIGTRVRYAKPHEYGGTFAVTGPFVRNITQVFGRPVDKHPILVSGYTMRVPERSFLRSSLRENRTSVLAAIRADLAKAD